MSRLDVMKEPKYRLKEAMPYQSVEEIEPWRISLLSKFLEIRLNRSYNQDKAEGYSLYIGTCLQLGEYVTVDSIFLENLCFIWQVKLIVFLLCLL